jgi:integrase/recombinase XerD
MPWLNCAQNRPSGCNRWPTNTRPPESMRTATLRSLTSFFQGLVERHDLAAEVWHIKEPERLPPVLSPEEVKRVLIMATSLKAQATLTLAYGCGLRAGEVVRLRAGDIGEQMIIRIV